ncbi:MAG: DUF6909 family protein [Anaerolineales bacterium]
MQRTVPHTASDPITLFMRTYYSLLRASDAIQINSLVESYLAMDSSLHVHARENAADVSTLVYTGLRLPECIRNVETILLGQTVDVFEKYGFPVSEWERVSAPGRRRRMHWDGDQTLAVFLSSRSDMDDLIPMLTAYQIEWNKIHAHLRDSLVTVLFEDHDTVETFRNHDVEALARELSISKKDVKRLGRAWDRMLIPTLQGMAQNRKNFRIRQLAGSLADYRKATARWWHNLRIRSRECELYPETHPVYFISSNMHSISNLVAGFAVRERDMLLEFLHNDGHEDLLQEYERMMNDEQLSTNEPNFFYYVSKKFLASGGADAAQRKQAAEQEIGFLEVPAERGFDVSAQLFALSNLREDYLDPRLMGLPDFNLLAESDALVMNIDYPLGMAAYELLAHVASRVGRLTGVYIMGKAATLNGRIGDVMVSNVIHDEHSKNSYLFRNAFQARQVAPYMTLGSVLDNQKAITAYGTFLQNVEYMDIFYEEGYTVIEMEGGPYLSAIYESVRPRRHPSNEIVRLYEAPLDIGIVHYASDTPFSKGKNLGAGSLGYVGVEPTYASAIAIMKRILSREILRMKQTDRSVTRIFDETFDLIEDLYET